SAIEGRMRPGVIPQKLRRRRGQAKVSMEREAADSRFLPAVLATPLARLPVLLDVRHPWAAALSCTTGTEIVVAARRMTIYAAVEADDCRASPRRPGLLSGPRVLSVISSGACRSWLGSRDPSRRLRTTRTGALGSYDRRLRPSSGK